MEFSFIHWFAPCYCCRQCRWMRVRQTDHCGFQEIKKENIFVHILFSWLCFRYHEMACPEKAIHQIANRYSNKTCIHSVTNSQFDLCSNIKVFDVNNAKVFGSSNLFNSVSKQCFRTFGLWRWISLFARHLNNRLLYDVESNSIENVKNDIAKTFGEIMSHIRCTSCV